MVTIRYEIEIAGGRAAVRERSFPSDEAMQRWVERKEEDPRSAFIGVIAYSFDDRRPA